MHNLHKEKWKRLYIITYINVLMYKKLAGHAVTTTERCNTIFAFTPLPGELQRQKPKILICRAD